MALANLTGRGRKPKISARAGRKLIRDVNNNPRLTSKDFLHNLSESGTDVLRSALQRVLHKHNLHAYRPRKTPLLKARPLKARLMYSRDHLKKDDSFWAQKRPKLSSLGVEVQPMCGGSQMRLMPPRIPWSL